MKKIFACALLFSSYHLYAQQIDSIRTDTSNNKQLKEVVVTATRSGKDIMQVPMPVITISNKEIKNRGLVRLNEILNEQTGLTVLPDAHGQGVQLQGFSPDYTMIMIDGQPIIGRTTGILELSRISVNNIDRIEVVKGPVSSLYGSEAMAGVVNIITATPPLGTSIGASARYGTNNTADLNINAGYSTKRLAISGFINRYSSSGYSLQPQSGSPTVAPFYGYTINGKVQYKLSNSTDFKLLARYYTNHQNNNFRVDSGQVTGSGTEQDLNVLPTITHRFSDKFTGEFRVYHSTYKTRSALNYTDNNALYDQTYFNQAFNRAEVQTDFQLHPQFKLTTGAGAQYESVEATRYDQKQHFTSGYAYTQADWVLFSKLNIIGGARFDAHSVYASQFSPKLAVSYKVNNRFTLLASTGKGYKAPDFRQLYLNFTNAVVGYSVFGSEDAAAQLQRLQQTGQIQNILIDPSTLRALNAESSTSYNAGFRYRPVNNIMWSVNFFRNNIRNLIDAQPIAIKNNGQSVYTYFNLYRVYTQGAETDLSYNFLKRWTAAGGFQYLEAYDQSVLDQINARSLFGIDPQTRETVRITKSMYGGLLNRSKYTANARLSYQDDQSGWIVSLRAIYRGRYGYADLDGNGIVNRNDEYVKGYVLFNASVSKLLLNNQLRLQITSENLGNFKNTAVISNLPGRLIYGGITYNLNKQ